MEGKGLGRHPAPDERDKNYPLRALMAGDPELASLPEYKYWWSPYNLDQNGYPRCVGYSVKTELMNGPVRRAAASPTADELYAWAQRNDEWSGEDYDGTSVRAGMKAAVHYTEVTEYRWAFTMDDVIRWLSLYGPLVVGTDWYEGMSRPHTGKDGRSWIEPAGAYQGGHAYGLNGVNIEQEKVRVENNWGREYGDKGFAWMSFHSLEYLLATGGDAACPLDVSA